MGLIRTQNKHVFLLKQLVPYLCCRAGCICVQVHAAEALGSTLHSACGSSLADMASLFQRTLEASRAQCQGFSSQAASGLKAVQASASQVVGSLTAALDKQAGQAQALGARQTAGVQASVRALQGLGATARTQLSGVQGIS